MGQDAGQLCEVARSKYRRFMLPSRDSRPEAGPPWHILGD